MPQPVLDAPKLGTIQYHPSLLPRHRGPSSINWPIIQGETKTGLTIFWPDEGLDEGPILLQKEVEIGPDETLGRLYFDKLFPMGVDAMLEAVDMIRDGTAPRVEQDHSQATYESWCRKDDAEIDWSKPVGEIYNLVRGTNPQPGAWTTVAGKVLKIFDCNPAEATGEPGEIIQITKEGFTVACGDGGLLVRRVRPHDSGKIAASEFVASASLTAGSRLGA